MRYEFQIVFELTAHPYLNETDINSAGTLITQLAHSSYELFPNASNEIRINCASAPVAQASRYKRVLHESVDKLKLKKP